MRGLNGAENMGETLRGGPKGGSWRVGCVDRIVMFIEHFLKIVAHQRCRILIFISGTHVKINGIHGRAFHSYVTIFGKVSGIHGQATICHLCTRVFARNYMIGSRVTVTRYD